DDSADEQPSRDTERNEDDSESPAIMDDARADAPEVTRLRDSPPTPSQHKGATLSTAATIVADEDGAAGLPAGTPYDEWDADAHRYLPRAAIVRISDPSERAAQVVVDVRQRHGALVRQIRHRFERLRARRMLLDRQRSGDELDLAACVDAA